MKRYYKVVLEQDEDKYYTATVPELPGCVSDGKTKREALRNIREAIAGYLETLRDEGWQLPKIMSLDIDRVAVEINAKIA